MFIQLDGIAIGPHDEIWVSDSKANRVRLIANDTITTIAGTGELAYSGDGGPAVDAAMFWPTALLLDDDGALLVAESRNHVVRRIASDGTISTIAGNGSEGFSGDGGPATAAQLRQPNGLARADDGTLFISDRANFRVRAVAVDGTITTFAGDGNEGNRGDAGPATKASFGYLARIALDGDGLLVADQSSSVVRRVSL
jgi:sugar lactone lactonase YvrE